MTREWGRLPGNRHRYDQQVKIPQDARRLADRSPKMKLVRFDLEFHSRPLARRGEVMERNFAEHGFLPASDPAVSFPHGSDLAVLDEIGHDLSSLLHDPGFRARARTWAIPPWQDPADP